MALALPSGRNHPHRRVRHPGGIGGDVRHPPTWVVAPCAGGGYGPPPFTLVPTQRGACGSLWHRDVHGPCHGDGDEPRLPSEITVDWGCRAERLAVPYRPIQIRAVLEPGCRRPILRESCSGFLPCVLGGGHYMRTSVSVSVMPMPLEMRWQAFRRHSSA